MYPMMIYSALLVAIAGTLVTGCASTPEAPALPEPRPLGADHVTVGQRMTASPAEDSPQQKRLVGTLSLTDALAETLLMNPELAAFSYAVRVEEAHVLQVSRYANPKFEVELEEYDRDGAGMDSSEMVLSIGQTFDLGGTRRWRTRLAAVQGELAGWDYESKRLDVFTSTVQRFVALIAANRRLELATATVEVWEKTGQAVAARVKAGKEPQLQATKAQAQLELARLARLEAQRDVGTSQRRLAAMWGSEHPQFDGVERDIDTILEVIPSLETMRSHLDANPDLARWDAERRMHEGQLSVAKAERIPDLEVRLGLQRYEEDGTDALALGVGLPLPLFNRNQSDVAAAWLGLAKAAAERRATEIALATALSEAHGALTSARDRVLALRSKVVPAMEDATATAQEGYRLGKFGFLDMLDSQRGLFEAKGALVDALEDYHGAVSAVQRLTGTPIEEFGEVGSE